MGGLSARRRYDDLCAQHHEAMDPLLDEQIGQAWAALRLRTRLRIMVVAPWWDAVYEVLAEVGVRIGRRPL